MNKKVLSLVHAAVIAALYVVLTFVANALGLSSGVIQIRFSEALTILPFFTPAAIPGLFAGCLLANLLTGAIPWDILFGSLATLLGAVGTYLLCGRANASAQTSPNRVGKTTSHPTRCAVGALRSSKTPCADLCIKKWLAPLPPILANTLIIPFVLAYAYGFEGGIPYFCLTVGIGELFSCGVLGILLLNLLQKYRQHIFPAA